MGEEILYLIVPDDGYDAEIQVSFWSEDLAEAHLDDLSRQGIGARIVPIQVLEAPPSCRPWWNIVTTVRPNGIVQRRDVHHRFEWSYEHTLMEEETPMTWVSNNQPMVGWHLIQTMGYDLDAAQADHDSHVRAIGGILL